MDLNGPQIDLWGKFEYQIWCGFFWSKFVKRSVKNGPTKKVCIKIFRYSGHQKSAYICFSFGWLCGWFLLHVVWCASQNLLWHLKSIFGAKLNCFILPLQPLFFAHEAWFIDFCWYLKDLVHSRNWKFCNLFIYFSAKYW